jgi:L-lactate dehydrogenase complex protein LldG
MSDAKADILHRIKRSLGRSAMEAPVPGWRPDRIYRQSGSLDDEERICLFIERLRDYESGVYRCRAGDIAKTVARALTERDKHRILVPEQIPEEWLPSQGEFVRDHGLAHEEIDKSDGVLTRCDVAIALTGTIILRHSQAEGRRALTLIPDYHLCVVHELQVVETVPEGLRHIEEVGRHPITTISGPSATADIEMTRVKGVHGPRTLDVILVSA